MAAAFTFASCGDDHKNDDPVDPVTPDKPTTSTVINGTTIAEGNNLAGLVTDSSTGKGIEGVPVSDGYSFTVTDANGVYQMEMNRYCRVVYITTPSAYQIPVDPDRPSIPKFYSTNVDRSQTLSRNDFTLTPLGHDETSFTLVMVGDPQCKTDAQVSRYRSETIPDIQGTLNTDQAYKYPYAMTLGDITFDNVAEWGNMDKAMSSVNLTDGYLPFFQCMGNHDHDASQSNQYRSQQNFVDHFGPYDYSFNRGNAHFVVMDNVMVTTSNGSTWSYNGGISAAQLRWLKEDLSYVKDKGNKIIFFCTHIPFRGGSAEDSGASMNKDKNYGEVLNLLTDFHEAHIMVGHTHYNQNWVHSGYVTAGGTPVYEHVHGTACGAWWNANTTVTGEPNGYTVYEVEGDHVKNWVMKGTNLSPDDQLRVYDGNQVYTGTKGYSLNWYTQSQTAGAASIAVRGNASLKGAFVADVFDEDDTYTTVEFYQNGVKVGDFTRLANNSCCNIAVTSYWFNEKGKNSATWASRTASHYWYYKPASGEPSSESNWEVRVTRTIPGSGEKNEFHCSTLTTDYSIF